MRKICLTNLRFFEEVTMEIGEGRVAGIGDMNLSKVSDKVLHCGLIQKFKAQAIQ